MRIPYVVIGAAFAAITAVAGNAAAQSGRFVNVYNW